MCFCLVRRSLLGIGYGYFGVCVRERGGDRESVCRYTMYVKAEATLAFILLGPSSCVFETGSLTILVGQRVPDIPQSLPPHHCLINVCCLMASEDRKGQFF